MAKFGFLDDPAVDGFELQTEDRIAVQKYTLEEAGTLIAVSVYLRGADSTVAGGSGSVLVWGAVYEDNGGEPGALLADGAVVGVFVGQREGWETFLFGGYELAAGDYWIGLHVPDSALNAFIEVGYQNATGTRRYATYDTDLGQPDPWPTATDTADTVELSMYAEYIPGGQVYDSTQHHIGLGYEGVNEQYGFLVDGVHRKDVQRDPTPEEFGGESDGIERVPSLARWTQDNFLGGMFAFEFGEDNAQFASCYGFLPSQTGRSLISVEPLVPKILESDESTEDPKAFIPWGQYVWRISSESYQRFDITTELRDQDIAAAANESIKAACLDTATRRIFSLEQNDGGTTTTLKQINPATAGVAVVDTAPTPPASNVAKGLMSDNAGNLYAVFGNRGQLWRIKPNSDLSNATWTKITDLPEAYVDSVVYNGFLYILCGDVDQRTVLLVFDGTNLSTLVEIPFNFVGRCLTVYGGRIYVGGTGLDVNGDDGYAELYEINGSSLRLVRTFAPFTRGAATGPTGASGSDGAYPLTINDLEVHEGLLWILTSPGGRGCVEVYDQTTDAFYGGPYFASEAGINEDVKNAVRFASVRGRPVLWVRDATADAETGIWMLTTDLENEVPGDMYHPTFVTSKFTVQPATEKRWSKIVVRTRNDHVQIYYRDPQLGSWAAGPSTQRHEGDYYVSEMNLDFVEPSEEMDFMFQGFVEDLAAPLEIVSFTVQFAFLDSGKHAWAFTIAVPSDIEAIDGTSIPQNVNATIQTLEEWQENRQPLLYTDVDGQQFATFIRDISVLRPIVGPPVGGTPEALVNITLLEV